MRYVLNQSMRNIPQNIDKFLLKWIMKNSHMDGVKEEEYGHLNVVIKGYVYVCDFKW